MSLNGLDDPKIKEAFITAAAEPGGWFLLHYISRDEVAVLSRGTGGIVEIRNAIAKYEEPSPLFGFLRYRRRNVVIKCVPEDCSRLVQARVTVHFNAVTEQLSPHDTVFSICNSKELRDTNLSAACSLHTASGSTSSSTSSLRRRRLMEIAEEEEEEIRAKRQSTVPEERPSTAKTHSIIEAQVPPSSEPALPTTLPSFASHATISTDPIPSPSNEPRKSEDRSRSPIRLSSEARRSAQYTRPDIYSSSSYGSSGRPKVKLGPRPSLDVGGRPHTSAAASFYRPVSTLPAGLKVTSKTVKKDKPRPQSQYITNNPILSLSVPPLPEAAASMPENALARPHTSGGRSTTTSSILMHPMKSPALSMAPSLPGITPERARLMKAQELRKKKMAAAKAAESEHTTTPLEETMPPQPPTTSEPPDPPSNLQPTLAMINHMAAEENTVVACDTRLTMKSDQSDATRSDSYPVSPVGASERAESTKASSISESTDETIQDTKGVTPADSEKSLSSTEPEDQPQPRTEEEELTPATFEALEPMPITQDPVEVATSLPETLACTEHAITQDQSSQTFTPEALVSMGEDGSVVFDPTSTNVALDIPDVDTNIVEPEIQVAQPEHVIGNIPQLQLPKQSDDKDWDIPRSKFSVQNPKDTSTVREPHVEDLPGQLSDTENPSEQRSPVGSTFSNDTRLSNLEDGTDGRAWSFKAKKRKGRVNPIRTDLDSTDKSGVDSDDNFSSDDEFMDELQSAVFQEAKPISVSKSPISPVFPSLQKPKGGDIGRWPGTSSALLRTKSTESQLLEPPSSSSHSETPRSTSASAAYLNRINSVSSKPLAKKVSVGSGISQRIKALEKLSSLAPDTSASSGTTAGTPTFFSVRKPSMRGPSQVQSIADRANSLTRNTPSPSVSRATTPDTVKARDRSPSMKSRLEAFNSSPTPAGQSSRSRPETVSVTAQIVRDPAQPFLSRGAGRDSLDSAPLDLKNSPLVIDHQEATEKPKKETILQRRLTKERPSSISSDTTKKERRSSITIIKDLFNEGRASLSEHRKSLNLERPKLSPQVSSPSRPPSTHMTTKIHQRQMSIGSRKSTSSRGESGSLLSPPPSVHSNEEKNDKKSNRASRMLHRMSSALSPRKTLPQTMSPTVREELEPALNSGFQSIDAQQSASTPAMIGISDVNVQFPDTLLWKRRSMFLDVQGYLIMVPALTAHATAKDKTGVGATRRFHLSEFRTPSIPDLEMQELPNSVVLEFLEGGGLQVACEDRAGQADILKVLQEAHRKWIGQ